MIYMQSLSAIQPNICLNAYLNSTFSFLTGMPQSPHKVMYIRQPKRKTETTTEWCHPHLTDMLCTPFSKGHDDVINTSWCCLNLVCSSMPPLKILSCFSCLWCFSVSNAFLALPFLVPPVERKSM